jgi:hypothetical protein
MTLDVWLPLKGIKTCSADVTAASFDDPSAVAKKFKIDRFA